MKELYERLDSASTEGERLRLINNFLKDSITIPEKERLTRLKSMTYELSRVPFFVGFKYKNRGVENQETLDYVLGISLDDNLLMLESQGTLFWEHARWYAPPVETLPGS
ncbi:hypothetical protein KW805_01330 [Candidatus Pacearchaeota archaeon]|nr:hypothetical protein [Candidatus Pacearchaeota archaeon]